MVSSDYNVSSEFYPFARRALKKLYQDNEVVSYGVMSSTEPSRKFEPSLLEVRLAGYAILPQGRNIEDYPEITTYLEDGEKCITGLCNIMEQYSLKRIMLLEHSCVEHLMQLQRRSGIYAHEIGRDKLRELTYYDMVNTKVMNYEEDNIFSHEMPKSYYKMVV